MVSEQTVPCLEGECGLMYVGLDVHKRVCHGAIMNGEGKIVKQKRFSNGPRGLDAFMGGVDGARVVMKAR